MKHFELSIICKSCRNGLHELCSSRRQHSSNLILIKCTCQECEHQYAKRRVAIEYTHGLSADPSNRKNEEITRMLATSNRKNEEITRMFSIAQKLDDDIQNNEGYS